MVRARVSSSHIREIAYSRHRATYITIPLNICGFVVLGAALQKHLSPGAVIMGWGIAEFSIMIGTVAVCESDLTVYNQCPKMLSHA